MTWRHCHSGLWPSHSHSPVLQSQPVSGVWQYLAIMAGLAKTLGHRICAGVIFLRPDANSMQLARIGRQRTQKCSETLLAKVGCKPLSVHFIVEAANLYCPHFGIRYENVVNKGVNKGVRLFSSTLCPRN